MRHEVMGMLRKIFNKVFLKCEVAPRRVAVVIGQRGVRALLAYLRYGSLAQGTALNDLSALDVSGDRGVMVVYVFLMRR